MLLCVRYARVSRAEPNSAVRSLARTTARVLSDSTCQPRSVRSAPSKHWQPAEGLSPEQVRAVIAAANCERDRLLPVLWAIGARISEALALRPVDVQRDSLVVPHRRSPNLTVKRVFLPGAELGLSGELLLWAKDQGVADHEPPFFSRTRDANGLRRALHRGQAWLIVKEASERANVRILALRASKHRAGKVRQSTLTCSATLECVRSCGVRVVSPRRNARPGGAVFRWRTLPSAMKRRPSSCAS